MELVIYQKGKTGIKDVNERGKVRVKSLVEVKTGKVFPVLY
jgi:hypothetical protein